MRFLLVASVVTLSACTTAIPYSPQRTMTFSEARDVVEEIVLTQHEAWRPDQVAVTEKFVSFDYGLVTGTVASLEVPVAVSVTRKNSGRAYYKYVTKVSLESWIRNFRKWYIIRLEGSLAIRDPTILRTRDINKAKRLFDALSSLIDSSRIHPVEIEEEASFPK